MFSQTLQSHGMTALNTQKEWGELAADKSDFDTTGMQQVSKHQWYDFGTVMEATLDYTVVDGRTSPRMIRSDSVPVAETPFRNRPQGVVGHLPDGAARGVVRVGALRPLAACSRIERMEASGSGGACRAHPRRNPAELT